MLLFFIVYASKNKLTFGGYYEGESKSETEVLLGGRPFPASSQEGLGSEN
jgi:hypothetical protein